MHEVDDQSSHTNEYLSFTIHCAQFQLLVHDIELIVERKLSCATCAGGLFGYGSVPSALRQEGRYTVCCLREQQRSAVKYEEA